MPCHVTVGEECQTYVVILFVALPTESWFGLMNGKKLMHEL